MHTGYFGTGKTARENVMDELKDVHYDAFISYRHSELDSFVAEQLHKKLESFKLSKAQQKAVKSGKTGISRVFRDVEELPLSENLSEPINNAIKNSDYLITICTPRYPQSRWCMKEIELFLKSHDRSHLLVVLADGEPSESFPEILTYEEVERKEEDGEVHIVRRELEPLAADTRGANNKEILKAMDTAVLKLCAAMFGLNYDDLRQRHREAKMRRIMTVFGIASAAFLIFAVVVTGMLLKISDQNKLISDQYQSLQDRYASQVATNAETLLVDGRRKDAVFALRSVLPDKEGEPCNADALKMMYKAMNIYGVNKGYAPLVTYDMDEDVLYYDVSADGKHVLVVTDKKARVFESRSGNVIQEFNALFDEEGNPGSLINATLCGTEGVIVMNADREGYFSLKDGSEHSYSGFGGNATFMKARGGEYIMAQEYGSVWAIGPEGEIRYEMDLKKELGNDYDYLYPIQCDQGRVLAQADGTDKAISIIYDEESGKILHKLSSRDLTSFDEHYYCLYGDTYYELTVKGDEAEYDDAGFDEADADEADPDETDLNEGGSDVTEADEAGEEEYDGAGTDEADPDGADADEADPDGADADEADPDGADPDEADPDEAGSDDTTETGTILRATDLKSGEVLWERHIDDVFTVGMVISDYGLYLYGGDATMINRNTGDIISHYSLDEGILTEWIGEDDCFYYMTSSGKVFTMADTGVLWEVTDDFFLSIPSETIQMAVITDKLIAVSQGTNYIVGYMNDEIGTEVKEGEGNYRDMYDYQWADDDELADYAVLNPSSIINAIYSDDGKYLLAFYSGGLLQILDRESKKLVKRITIPNSYGVTLWYCDAWDTYVLDTEDVSRILNEDFDTICEMPLIQGTIGNDLIVLGQNYEDRRVEVVRYDELIRSSDEYLGDYEPSQEIREKYDFE